jgi:phosphoglycolate phosphatase-like HAD superfamily hydrolase
MSKQTFKNVYESVFGFDITDDDLPEFSGMTDLGIVKHISERTGVPFFQVLGKKNEFWREMSKQYADQFHSDNVYLHDNAEELIEGLSGREDVELGILSGNNINCARLKLDVFDLARKFTDGAFGDDHHDRNSLPRIAWDRFSELHNTDFRPNKTLIIGDSPRDIECAKSCGIKVISVATGNYSIEQLQRYSPDHAFETLPDLEQMDRLLKEMF